MGFLDGKGQEQQQAQQQQVYDNAYSNLYNPPQQQVPADVIKYRLESTDLIDVLEHDLRGEQFINGKWQGGYGRWVNDEGLSIIRSIVTRYNNRGCYLGNLNPDQINYKCCDLKKELGRMIFKKYRLYGIDKAKRTLLIRSIVDTVHLSLTRSENGREGDQISTTSSVSEIIHKDNNLQQNKLLGIIPWNK